MTLKLTQEEYDMLTAVSEHDGLNFSDWIRFAVRKAFRQIAKAK